MNFVSCNIFCSLQFIVHGKSCLSKVEVGNFASFGSQLPELSFNFLAGLVHNCIVVLVKVISQLYVDVDSFDIFIRRFGEG